MVSLNDVNDAPLLTGGPFTVPENSARHTVVGTLTATDVDAGQTVTLSLVAGNELGAFALSGQSLVVAEPAALDFETKSTFELTVRATDDAATPLSTDLTVEVQLIDVNEAPALADTTLHLGETAENGAVVGPLLVVDPDVQQSHTFAILGGNTGDTFALNPASGLLTVASNALLDADATPTFVLTVRVTDSGTPTLSDEATVTINIVDSADLPVLSGGSFTVNEHLPAGSPIGTLNVTNGRGAVSFGIVAGNTGGAFGLDPATGVLTVANQQALDFETSPVFTLAVRATDERGLNADATVTVSLNDVNEAPTLSGGPFTVAENSPADTLVGTLAAADVDAGQTVTLSIVAGNEQDAFALSGHTLLVANAAALDFESRKSFELTVRATDDAATPLSVELVVEVQLVDVNEPPVLTGGPFTVPENSEAGTEIGTLSVADEDEGQTVSLNIVAGDDEGRFALSGQTLVVAEGAVLDFETTPTFTLTVRATDDGEPFAFSESQVVIDLTDVNEAPMLLGASFTVPENSPGGTIVGQLTATDVDAGQILTLKIIAGDEAKRFMFIGRTLVVLQGAGLDYETMSPFVLTVRVTDDGSPPAFAEAQVTVEVLDVNEPPILQDVTLNVEEDAMPGDEVGVFSVIDPDAGQSHVFELVAGNDGDTFALHPTTGALTVLDSTLLDYETRPTFTLTVEATDDGTPGQSQTRRYTVNVIDVNEPPTFADTTVTVAENSPEGTLVGVLTASDPDAGDVITFSLEPGHDDVFALTPTGHLTVADSAALDFETRPSFTLSARATDGSGLFDVATVTVELQDVNEPPRLTAETTLVIVPEDKPVGSQLVKFTTADDDVGQTVSLSIHSGNTGGAFSISDGWLVVADLTAFDFEKNPSFDLTVRATDDGSPPQHVDLALTVQLRDVNEPPVLAAGQAFSVPSDADVGLTLGHLVATDLDYGQSLTWSFPSGETTQGYFGIEASTGRLFVASITGPQGPLSGLLGHSMPLTVRVTDSGSPQASTLGNVTMTVTGPMEPPQSGSLNFFAYTDGTYKLNIADYASLGTPRAEVVTFGGGDWGVESPAGSSIGFTGGSFRVDADGTITASSHYSGSLAFNVRVENAAGSADLDVVITFCVALEPGGSIHYVESSWMCLKGGAEYVLVPTNLTDTETPGTGAVNLSVLAQDIVPVVGAPSPVVNPLPGALTANVALTPTSFTGGDTPTRNGSFDAALRRQEKELLEPMMAGARAATQRGLNLNIVPGVPQVEDFMTLNTAEDACDVADNRVGRVEAVSDRAIVVDEWKADKSGPLVTNGFSRAQFEQIAQRFDDEIWPVIVSTFGPPLDIDQNGRVVIFYTSAVNELTPPGSSSYVGGFVHSRDVFPTEACQTSNVGEMFYMLSPDPDGLFGNERSVEFVLGATFGTLAHEFQHLINASRRLYVNEASTFETVWLNEGLSHIAEELMFQAAAGVGPGQNLELGDILGNDDYRDAFNEWGISNFGRLQSWLAAPEAQGPFAPNDTLATRGSIWAFLRYAADRKGGNQYSFWSALLNSTTAGLENLDEVLEDNTKWWMSDFALAMYLDDTMVGLGAHFDQPSWNFRSVYLGLAPTYSFPLAVRDAADGTPTHLTLAPGGGSAYVRMGVAVGQHAQVSMLSDGYTPPETVELSLIRRK